jgi:hypothetical protein
MNEPPESAPQQSLHSDSEPSKDAPVEEVISSADSTAPEVVEGAVDSLESAPGGPQFSEKEHHAKATKQLALLLFAALVGCFVANYVTILCLAHNKANSVDEISRVFNTWTPIFSGLFGSAATFYFTQGRK